MRSRTSNSGRIAETVQDPMGGSMVGWGVAIGVAVAVVAGVAAKAVAVAETVGAPIGDGETWGLEAVAEHALAIRHNARPPISRRPDAGRPIDSSIDG
jgi:hypothetical protein